MKIAREYFACYKMYEYSIKSNIYFTSYYVLVWIFSTEVLSEKQYDELATGKDCLTKW